MSTLREILADTTAGIVTMVYHPERIKQPKTYIELLVAERNDVILMESLQTTTPVAMLEVINWCVHNNLTPRSLDVVVF